MKNKVLIYFSTLLFFGTFLISCIEENENLVNPPSNIETINIRFINLAGDFESRTLLFDGKTQTDIIHYSNSSKLIHPPTDSAFISIRKGVNNEFAQSRMVKFQRNLFYSYFALPSPKGDTNYKVVDTIVSMTTSLAMPGYSTDAYIKLFNAYPDTTVTFSLLIGCPNSEPLFIGTRYREITLPKFIRTGKVPISITKLSAEGTELIGTYEVNLEIQGQYAIVISENQSSSINVMFLNEKELESKAFNSAVPIEQRFSEVRLINLSSQSVTATKLPGDVISLDLPSEKIGKYVKITACSSNSKDSVSILSGNTLAHEFSASFEVLERYSIIVADNGSKLASNSVLVPPSRILSLKGNSAVRVVNLADKYSTFDLSVSSRNKIGDSLGYTSGTSLAKALKYGTISGSVLLDPGELPLALFTTYSPVELLKTSITQIEANKEYLIIVTNDSKGDLKLNLVENNTEDIDLSKIEESSFIQIVNAASRNLFANINVDNSITNAKLYRANTLATNVKVKAQEISFTINGIKKVINFEPKIDTRYSLILSGDKENPDYILLENKIRPIDRSKAERRFVNASSDFQTIWVVENITKDTIPFALLQYKENTFFDYMDKVKRYTYYFFNPDTKKSITNFVIDVTLGKRYTLVFSGTNKDKFGFSVIQIQEY